MLAPAAAPVDAPHRHAADFVAHTVGTALAGGYQVVIDLYSARDDSGLEWDKEVLDAGTMAGAGCAAGDLNGDKRIDVACIGTATQNLKWYENIAVK